MTTLFDPTTGVGHVCGKVEQDAVGAVFLKNTNFAGERATDNLEREIAIEWKGFAGGDRSIEVHLKLAR